MSPPRSRLQQEIAQTRPFRSPEQECVVGLLRTADVVRHRLAESVSTHGITLQQYNVLRILRGAGPDGLPTLEIGQRMVERSPGVTRLLDRLVRKGLVARGRTRPDQRCVVCRITERGLELLDGLDGLVEASERTLLGGLPGDGVRRLIRLLDEVRAGEAPEPRPDPHQGARGLRARSARRRHTNPKQGERRNR